MEPWLSWSLGWGWSCGCGCDEVAPRTGYGARWDVKRSQKGLDVVSRPPGPECGARSTGSQTRRTAPGQTEEAVTQIRR